METAQFGSRGHRIGALATRPALAKTNTMLLNAMPLQLGAVLVQAGFLERRMFCLISLQAAACAIRLRQSP